MKYEVTVPIAGAISVTVEADDPEEAREKAVANAMDVIEVKDTGGEGIDDPMVQHGALIEINPYDKIIDGNVACVPYGWCEIEWLNDE